MEEIKKESWRTKLFNKFLDQISDPTGTGSSKRATAAWIVIMIFSPLQWIYTYALYKIVTVSSNPVSKLISTVTGDKINSSTTYAYNATIDLKILDLFIYDVLLLIILILLIMGLTSVEKLSSFTDSVGNLMIKLKGGLSKDQ